MKLALVAGLALALTSRSSAEPLPEGRQDAATVGETIRERIDAAFVAIKKKQTAKVLPVLSEHVSVQGLSFSSAKCKRFAADDKVDVKGASRAALVTCLAGEKWFTAKVPFRLELSAGTWTAWVRLAGSSELTEIVLEPQQDGTFRIRGIHAPLGVEGGVFGDPRPEPKAGGVVFIDSAPPAPPAPTTPTTQTVPPRLLEQNRIAGDKVILPDDPTKTAITRSQKERVIASLKLCVDVTGKVSQVKLLKSSGFPDYDRKLEAGMNTWAYRPYVVDGKAIPVCTAVTFIYAQK
jgi:hypothetical protein